MDIKLLMPILVLVVLAATIETADGVPSLIGRRVLMRSAYYRRFMRRHPSTSRVLLFKTPTGHRQSEFFLFASFDVVPGLSGVGISFRSVNYPDHYIRKSRYSTYLHKFSNSEAYKEDASFIPRERLAYRGKHYASFESVRSPGLYLSTLGNRVGFTRLSASSRFRSRATWYPVVLRNVVVSGEWSLLYGNDNAAASGNYTIVIEEGVTVGSTSSVTRSQENSWKFGVEAQASGSIFGVSLSLKTMFETSGRVGISRTRSSSWEKSTKSRVGYTARLVKGQPFYLWQWCVHATTADSAYITSKTDIYSQTTTYMSPPPIKTP